MKVYKATDKDMKCRGLQYEIGKTVEAEGELKLCKNGLHACEAPIDMLNHYAPYKSRYFEAEADGVSGERGDDSKIVARKLTLGAEIGIPGLVKAQTEYTREKIGKSQEKTGGDMAALTGGDMAALTGGYRAALTGGYRAALTGGEGAVLSGLTGAKYKGGMWSVFSAPQFDEHRRLCGNIVAVVDGEKIKPDTWYTLKDGEFVEVPDNE